MTYESSAAAEIDPVLYFESKPEVLAVYFANAIFNRPQANDYAHWQRLIDIGYSLKACAPHEVALSGGDVSIVLENLEALAQSELVSPHRETARHILEQVGVRPSFINPVVPAQATELVSVA